jgi:hypothetical protein
LNGDDPLPSPRRAWESWFWGALLVGALLRLYLIFFTSGTYDVEVWQGHALTLGERDLASYYRAGSFQFNHPPPISQLISGLFPLSQATGIPFSALLRLPFAVLDFASVLLILRLLAGRPEARAIAAIYWLHPLAMIYSSYHGNTDTAVACFLLACAYAASRGHGAAAGAILGLSLWIKIPGLLAGPALLLALPDSRERIRFCVAGGAAVLVGYGPALVADAEALIDAVFLYSGLPIHTSSGVTTWGWLNLLPDPASLPRSMRLPLLDLRDAGHDHNTLICVVPIVLFAWLRRNARDPVGLAGTITGTYALFYGLTNFWAFQYLAWSIPFWFIGSRSFGWLASLFSTVYVYGAYAWLCGDPLLMGEWDFIGKPDWPGWLLTARDAANAFFLIAGLYLLAQAGSKEIRSRRESAADSLRD